MSVTQASDTENMQVKINSTDKQSKNGDEEIEGMSVSDVPEFQDPAILVVSEVVRLRYTKEELLKLRDAPLSRKKPEFLDTDVSPSIFDPERWNFENAKKQSTNNKSTDDGPTATATSNTRNNNSSVICATVEDHRRRPGADPRERVRKEGDGIILSPQRRSFISGCFVPARSGAASEGGRGAGNGSGQQSAGSGGGGRSHSPLGVVGGGKGDGHVGIREIQPSGSRRIGSGRILRDSWDSFNDKSDMGGGSEDYGNGYRNQRGTDRDRDDNKYERRSFGRDFEMTRDRGDQNSSGKERRSNARFDRRRISENRELEEPEWFSGGPISQNDTIELRGFDDSDRPGKKKLSPSRIRRAKEWSKKKNNNIGGDISDDSREDTRGNSESTTTKAAAASTTTSTTLPARVENDKQLKKTEKDDISSSSSNKEDKTSAGVAGATTSSGDMMMNEQSFNFDDILKCDTIPGLLTNGVEEDGETQAKSRFSRWFKKPDSPEDKKMHQKHQHPSSDSRRSSLHDDHHLIIKDLLKDISETNVTIPGDSEAYFAPISPAGNNTHSAGGSGGGFHGATAMRHGGGGQQMDQQHQGMSIMEMLQRGKKQAEKGINKQQSSQLPGKILSLDELEAKMRHNAEANSQQKHQQKPDEEMTAAFKKLLAQAQVGGHSVTANGPLNKSQQQPPMSLLEMLNHSQQQDEAARLAAATTNNPHLLMGGGGAAGGGGAQPTSPNVNHQHHPQQQHHHHQQHQLHLVNELQLKLQQQAQFQQHHQQQKQMEMLNKLINATSAAAGGSSGQMTRSSPALHDVGAQSRELLSRPEAQAILQGLKRGEITTQHLYTQLANPALQPRHREMLATIIKVQGGGGGYGGPSPRVLSPVPPPAAAAAAAAHHMSSYQQQLRVSPLPPNAMHQRIPSPRELQVHTQNILQRALIKKKLEEQQENYRKKQEMQRGNSPASAASNNNNIGQAKSVSSPTPLAFTPTSVLRKMTADKDEGKENKGIIGGEVKMPQGRALTGMRQQPQPQQLLQQHQPQQTQGQQWNTPFSAVKQPAGRPIVKANNNYQSAEQFFSQQQQRMFMQQAVAAAQPLQQQRKTVGSGAPAPFNFSQVSSSSAAAAAGSAPPSQYSSYQSNANQQQFTQQQLRAQHQHRPANQQQPQQQQPQQGQQQSQQQLGGYQQQQQQPSSNNQQNSASAGPTPTAWQQFFNSAQQASRGSNNPMGRSNNDLSPTTSDQLARWFSPDLLERARGGELPSTAGLGQNALSLEEIERQTAPPVHN